MILTIAAILLILWILGMIGGVLLGGFLHVLIAVAVVLFVWHLLSGRRHPV
jgi:hypothetical protein